MCYKICSLLKADTSFVVRYIEYEIVKIQNISFITSFLEPISSPFPYCTFCTKVDIHEYFINRQNQLTISISFKWFFFVKNLSQLHTGITSAKNLSEKLQLFFTREKPGHVDSVF